LTVAILPTLLTLVVRHVFLRPQWDDSHSGLDHYTQLLGDGFHYYKTRSEQGGNHQGWKDSGDAIVYDDGSQVHPKCRYRRIPD